jgi:hypothetical protein
LVGGRKPARDDVGVLADLIDGDQQQQGVRLTGEAGGTKSLVAIDALSLSDATHKQDC